MAKSIALKVSPHFKAGVKDLLDQWKPIKEGYANLAKQHLDFAKMIVKLWQQAKAFDRKSGSSLHKDYMREELQQLVQTDDPSILSRWRTIGEQADFLLPVSKHLPSDRDHLYQLATAVKKDKPVTEWVKSKKVHPAISVNEIKFLKTDGARKKSIARTMRTQSVTFNFSSDLEAKEIVEILQSAIQSDKFESLIASQSIFAECEDSMREGYAKLKPKFIDVTKPKTSKPPRKSKPLQRK